MCAKSLTRYRGDNPPQDPNNLNAECGAHDGTVWPRTPPDFAGDRAQRNRARRIQVPEAARAEPHSARVRFRNSVLTRRASFCEIT